MFILLMSPKEHVIPVDYLITKDFTGLKNFMSLFSYRNKQRVRGGGGFVT